MKLKFGFLSVLGLTALVFVAACSNNNSNNSEATPSQSNMSEGIAPIENIPPVTAPPEELSETSNLPKTSINFKQKDHDFGKINQETENKKVFKFTNTGKEPLLISNAVGSCGCTVPEYPKEPIAPGKTGEIVVIYKPGQQKGSQSKTVTLTANTEPTTTVLNIKADVQELKK